MKNPEIRFIDDNIDWEERKLGELNNLSIPTIYKNYYLEIGDIKPLSNSYTLDKTKKIVSGAKLATNGTILVSTVRPTRGAICKLKDGNIFVSSALYQFNSNNEFLNDIILQQLQTYKFLKYCGDNCEGGTYPTISKENIDKFIVKIPKNVEKISKTLTSIDVKITNQTAIIEKLYNTKSALLIKMFPQENQSVPELRFDGFTDTWEQRKLEDYLDVSNKKNIKGLYSKQNVLSVSGEYGIVNQIEFLGRSFAGKSVLNYSIVNKGDIVYTKSPLNTNPYGIVKTNKNDIGIVSTLYAIYTPKENTNPNFVQDYFDLHYRLNAYLHPLVHKGAKNDMKISSQNALKGIVTFPSYEEQTAISNLFEKLNNLITLHQRKLDKLKEVKSALLDKLLI